MSTPEKSQLLQILHSRRGAIASAWYRGIYATGFVPLSPTEIRTHLLALTDLAIACLLAEKFERSKAHSVGTGLARLHYLTPEVLERTHEVLGHELIKDLPPDQVVRLQPRLLMLLGGVGTGFFAQARDMILGEQEDIRSALIAERQRVEQALRESQSILAEAQRIARLGHYEYDFIRDDLRWSDEVYRLFGVDLQEFGGTLDAFLERMHPDDRATFQKAVEESFKTGRFDFEHRIVRGNGEIGTVHQSGEVVFDTAGNPIRVLGTVHDISERKALESAKDLPRFLAMVAHDLANPVAILLGRIHFLRSLVRSGKGNLSEAEQRSLISIETTARRIQRLVSDLQDASHIQAQRFQVEPVPMDLVEVVQQVVEEQQATTDLHRIVVTAPEHVIGKWDRDRIAQLLTNLMSNAIKHSPAGGELMVSVDVAHNETVLSVSDRGIGIAPEQQEHIFSPFARFAPAKMTGRGLGLYISKAIVEAHGGRIWVESEVNEGTTFFVALPLTLSQL